MFYHRPFDRLRDLYFKPLIAGLTRNLPNLYTCYKP